MTELPEKSRADLAKILGLLGSTHAGERDAAVLAASRLLDRHGIRWHELLSLTAPAADRREAAPPWRELCARLQRRPGDLRPWERQFVASLAAFPRLSAKQSAVLRRIAERVLETRGSGR